MNNSNLSEMVLDSQNQTIDFAEYELDETALECVNGGSFWEDVGELFGNVDRMNRNFNREVVGMGQDIGRGFVGTVEDIKRGYNRGSSSH